MNRSELIALLKSERVRNDCYSIDRQSQDYSLCLEVVRGGWAVYYWERGLRVGEDFFETEDEACDSMALSLLASGANRTGFRDPRAPR